MLAPSLGKTKVDGSPSGLLILLGLKVTGAGNKRVRGNPKGAMLPRAECNNHTWMLIQWFHLDHTRFCKRDILTKGSSEGSGR